MGMLGPVIGGIFGGVVGVFIWVEVGYFTNYEVGYIAWGVGFLVGFGVRYAAHMGGKDASPALGILAAVTAICCILVAKYIVLNLATKKYVNTALAEMHISFDGDDAIIAKIANQIVAIKMRRGDKIAWPEGMTADNAYQKPDYPPEIWKEAEQKWNNLDPKKRDEQRMIMQKASEMVQALRPDFQNSFRLIDILWFFLATVTAFKIGIGTYGSK
jgi:hypothetical protein